MSNLSLGDNILTVGSTEITFDYEIGDGIEFDSVIVVRLVIPPEGAHNRNRVGIDKTGTERWTIPERRHSSAEDNPCMSLRVRDGELWAGNWRGWTYRVDLETGELREYKFTK